MDPHNPYGQDDGLPSETAVQGKQTELQEWMFLSVDREGKVIVNSISKVMFIYKSSKYTLAEASKHESKYFSISCRFRSFLHPQAKINDLVTLVAVGNEQKVMIFAINNSKSQLIKEIFKPKYHVDASTV